MARDKLMKARDLIRQQKYVEARELLRGIDHPKAEEWRQRIDEMLPPEKPKTAGLVIGVVVVVLLLVGALAVFLVVNQTIQLPGSAAPPPTVAVALDDNNEAADDSEAGCPLDRWWNETVNLFDATTFIGLIDGSDEAAAQATQLAAYQSSRETYVALPYPDCVAEIQAALLEGLDAQIAGLAISNETPLAETIAGYHTSLVAYQRAALGLQALGVSFNERQEFEALLARLIGTCPVELWLAENIFSKPVYMEIPRRVDQVFYSSDPLTGIQNFSFDLRGENLKLRYAETPLCLNAARQHFTNATEAFVMAMEAIVGRDAAGFDQHLNTVNTEFGAFEQALADLGVPLRYYAWG
jgi:hypothetical protein